MTYSPSYKAPLVLFFLGCSVCFLGFFFTPFAFDSVFGLVLKKLEVLSPSSPFFAEWSDPPIPIYMKFYVFDIQNRYEILDGAKPIVTEKGPYVYRMYLPKQNMTWNNNNTLTYRRPWTWIFNRNLSQGPEEDIFMTVGIPFMSAVDIIRKEPWYLKEAFSGAAALIKEDIFKSITVSQLLWGYDDPLMEIIHKYLGDKFYQFDQFGFFVGRNNTDDGLFTVHTGNDQLSMLNVIDKYNGDSYLDLWNSPYCNRINGTDGTLYHPKISKKETLYLFVPDQCRSVPYLYVKDVTFKGFPLWRFQPPKDLFRNGDEYPPNKCYCVSDQCLPTGLLDTRTCKFGAPAALSNPHYLYTSPTVQDYVIGLQPDPQKHFTFLDIDSKTGLPLHFAARYQINLKLQQDPYISQTKNMSELYLPLFWFEEVVEIAGQPEDAYRVLVTMETFGVALQYLIFCIGIIMLSTGVFLAIIRRKEASKSNVVTIEVEDDRAPLLRPDDGSTQSSIPNPPSKGSVQPDTANGSAQPDLIQQPHNASTESDTIPVSAQSDHPNNQPSLQDDPGSIQ